MFHRIEELWRGLRSMNYPDRCFGVALLLIVCCAAVGCCTRSPQMIPMCPEASDEMILEIIEGRVPPATMSHLARQENLCWALLRLGAE